MVRRDFESRFVGSAGGWLWSVVHPLVQLLCYTFIFQICLRFSPTNSYNVPYALLIFCGQLPWMLFAEAMTRSSNCLIEQQNLITKTVFPSEVIPISIFLSSLISHLIALTMVVVSCILWRGYVSGMIVMLPFYMLLTGLLAIGLGWITSSLQVYLRDTGQVVSVILTLWFWITPIFISETDVPENLRFLVHYNPMTYAVRAYQKHLLSYQMPDFGEMAMLAAFAFTAFILGGLFFRHLKRGFADVL